MRKHKTFMQMSPFFWSLMTQCSIPVRSEQVEYIFNLSTVASTEKVLTAELHLFKLRPQATLSFHRHHFCQVCALTCGPLHQTRLFASVTVTPPLVIWFQVSIYQKMDTSRGNGTQDKKLLSSRLVPIHSAGWEVFTITQAVSNISEHGETHTHGGLSVS